MNVRRAAYRRSADRGRVRRSVTRSKRPKGALFLDALRRRMGDDAFLKLMRDYFAANTTKTVTAQSFLDQAGATFNVDAGDGPEYVTTDIRSRLRSAILVYGTVREAGANRYAAEQLQKQFLDAYESAVPIRKDFEATDEDLRQRDVIFVGRPEANSALADWSARLGLDYGEDVFRLGGRSVRIGTRCAVVCREESAGPESHGFGGGGQRRPAHRETGHPRRGIGRPANTN